MQKYDNDYDNDKNAYVSSTDRHTSPTFTSIPLNFHQLNAYPN